VLAFMPYLLSVAVGYPETYADILHINGHKKAQTAIGSRHNVFFLTLSVCSVCFRPPSSLRGCDLLPCSD
jgi:hypothetical protein